MVGLVKSTCGFLVLIPYSLSDSQAYEGTSSPSYKQANQQGYLVNPVSHTNPNSATRNSTNDSNQ